MKKAIIGKKVGMTQIFDEMGKVIPVTVIEAGPCVVTQKMTAEKEGYEADDVLGTLSKRGEQEGIDVTILSGDRDNFQLTSDKVTVRIPRTKMGKTEVEDFDRNKIIETYGIEPVKLIEVKGLQGDTSDNIPGVPGIGEKTALSIIKEYGSIDNLYKEIEEGQALSIKGKTREKIIENKDLAILSRTLGKINREVPIEESIEDLKVKPWNYEEVYEDFRALKFNRYIERFNLSQNVVKNANENELLESKIEIKKITLQEFENIEKEIKREGKFVYYFGKKECNDSTKIIKKEIISISIYVENIVYYIEIKDINEFEKIFKTIFEDSSIEKIGYKLCEDFVILKEQNIEMNNLSFDIEISAYLLNPTNNKYIIEDLSREYLELDIQEYLNKNNVEKESDKQINLFENINQKEKANMYEESFICFSIAKLKDVLEKKMIENNEINLFKNIEMPLVKVLAQIQYNGMYIDKEE